MSKGKFKTVDKRGIPQAGDIGQKKPEVLKITQEIPDPPVYENINLSMRGDRMLLQDFPAVEKYGSIFTPQNVEIFVNQARVVAIGAEAKGVEVGDVIFKIAGQGQTLVDEDGSEYIFLPSNAAIAIDKKLSPKPRSK